MYNFIFNFMMTYLIYSILRVLIAHYRNKNKKLLLSIEGVLLGLSSIIILLYPTYLDEGIILPVHFVFIGIITYLDGFLPGVIFASIYILFRTYLGGIGVFVAIPSTFLYIILGLQFRKKIKKMRLGSLLLFCLIASNIHIFFSPFFLFQMTINEYLQFIANVYLLVAGSTFLVSMFSFLVLMEVKKYIESRYKFKIVANYTGDWEYWYNYKGGLEYMSPNCESVTGYSIEEFISDLDLISKIVIEEDQQQWKEHLNNARNTHHESITFRIKSKSGQIRWIEHKCIPITVDNKKYDHRASNRDVTDRMQMIEAMMQSEKMLSLGGMAAGLAHEIKNPLSSIIQNIQNLNRKLLSDFSKNNISAEKVGISMEKIKKYVVDRGIDNILENLNAAGKNTFDIIENMLSFSRNGESKKEFCEVDDLINKSVKLFLHYSENKEYKHKININCTIEEEITRIYCEESKIQQVVINILRNGAEAMFDNHVMEPEFSIDCYSEGSMVSIAISNNGSEIPENVKKHIFEPFFTTKAKTSGTGLGLFISYFIITEHHNGKIEVLSDKENGTRFIISLPISNP